MDVEEDNDTDGEDSDDVEGDDRADVGDPSSQPWPVLLHPSHPHTPPHHQSCLPWT